MDQARKYKAKLHIFHVIMPSDPCGYSILAEKTPPDDADGNGNDIGYTGDAADSDEDLAQQAIGALGIPEKDRATRVRTAANVSKYAPCEVVVIQKRIQPAFGI
jgi:hypothetical protein